MNNYAIDTASRFGEIPFVEFTKELVTGVFDSLTEAHILQMEGYADFVNSLTQDLSTYINNTQDNVSFDQISDFILSYELPKIDIADLTKSLGQLQPPPVPPTTASTETPPVATSTWWEGLINTLAPAVAGLVDKIKDPSEIAGLAALNEYNNQVLNGATLIQRTIPTFSEIHDAIAALITSNKYGLLQTIAKQGVMRLVVTEGEIETKITFSTWNNTFSETSALNTAKDRTTSKDKRGILGQIFKGRDKTKTRHLTVNTAKSYQRDSSGTSVDIFGRVLIKFKTDYAPLNG